MLESKSNLIKYQYYSTIHYESLVFLYFLKTDQVIVTREYTISTFS